MDAPQSDVRPAELAGKWYPADANGCDAMLEKAAPLTDPLPAERVGAVVPHAGWVYSGEIAFGALRALEETNHEAELIVVFGGHLGPRDTPRVMIEGGWDTPYGPLSIAREAAEDLSMAINAEPETPDDFYDDNGIEVVMPMIKKLWPNAEVLTIGVPPTDDAPNIGAEAIRAAKRRRYQRIAVVGSTDLTHYGPNYSYSPMGRGKRGLDWVKQDNDPALMAKIEALDASKVLWVAQRQRSACCPGAVAAAIIAARKLGAERAVTTRYTTSWDVRPEGEPSSFVGYAGMILGR